MTQPASKRFVMEDSPALAAKIDTATANSTFAAMSRLGIVLPDTVSYADLQAAANSAATFGTRMWAAGAITTSSTLSITSDADLSQLTINYTGTGVAVRVGVTTGFLQRLNVKLPHIVAANKTALGWAQVVGTVGVEISNLYTAEIGIPEVHNFETGVQIKGVASNGVSYVNVFLGHLWNNKRNMRFTADATGWANQNNVYGGRMSHDSGEGTSVAGTRHVLIDNTASKVNNNNFFGTSLESPNAVEFHLDCSGNDNYWHGCRWENTGTGARVIWGAGSIGNVINHGFGSHSIVETVGVGAFNEIRSRARSRYVGDGNGGALLNLENTFSSTSPIMRLYEAGTLLPDATGTAWAADISAQKWRGKRAADANERLIVDYLNGRIYVGNGSAATARYFGNVGTSMGFDGASIGFVTHNTYDFGIAGLLPRYIRAGTAVQTGAVATGSRPSASTAGAGAMVYDSTLSKPIWSDGTVWRDAMGTAV